MKELDPTNKGEDCCDDLAPDDGRSDDGENHKGDWGSHSEADLIHEEVVYEA